jgi:hypothetical protein
LSEFGRNLPHKNPTMIVYCRCKYAKVVPQDVKDGVLEQLIDSRTPFEAVPDLCEMAARSDRQLARFCEHDDLRIAACYPRTIVNLFLAAGAALRPDQYRVGNMRTQTAEEVVHTLQDPGDDQGASQ